MGSFSLARVPVPIRLGAAAAVTLLATAACASSATSSATPPAAPASPAGGSSSSGGTVITTASSSGGSFLTDGSGRAIYLFTGDSKNKSNCPASCTAIWPAVTVTSMPTTAGSAQSSALGMITRSDGTKQATYDGHPLYYFVQDTKAGMVGGQGMTGFGHKWYLIGPSGSTITASVTVNGSGGGGAPSSSPSSGGGYGY